MAELKKVRLEWYAYFRERRGASSEEIETSSSDLRSLYCELAARHGFKLPATAVRAVMDGEFCDMGAAVKDGAVVAFVPPVAGG